MHEQMRPDRDEYVTINWQNMYEWHHSQFVKCEKCDVQDTKYDLQSVMHYESNAFSKSPYDPYVKTIETKDGKPISRLNGFSDLDVFEINQHYCGNICKMKIKSLTMHVIRQIH